MAINVNGVVCTTEEELEVEIAGLSEEQQMFLRNDFRGCENLKWPPVRIAEIQVVPTFAVDKNLVDQPVSGGTATKITSERVIWDTFENYDLPNSQMAPKEDGVWNLNGTLTFTDLVGAESVCVDVYRNNELWFTVAYKEVDGAVKLSLPFSCDVDAYASYGHTFDLRVTLLPAEATATVSGSDEETAWGMTYLATLSGESPTG
jgi:hypothetical protein